MPVESGTNGLGQVTVTPAGFEEAVKFTSLAQLKSAVTLTVAEPEPPEAKVEGCELVVIIVKSPTLALNAVLWATGPLV